MMSSSAEEVVRMTTGISDRSSSGRIFSRIWRPLYFGLDFAIYPVLAAVP